MASASVVLTSDTSGSVTVTVPSGTALGTTTLTLPTSGGTIQTSGAGFTTNGVAYASSTSALTTGSSLVFSSGNLGVGTSPSAWGSGTSVIDLATGGSAGALSSSGTLSIASNGYFNGTNWIYKNSSYAQLYQMLSGQHTWQIAPIGTGTISFTQAMTLDTSGNLLVGATSLSYNEKFVVKQTNTTAGNYAGLFQNVNDSGNHGIRVTLGANAGSTSTWHFAGVTSGQGAWYLYGNGTTSYSSDERLKKNIQSTRDGYLEDLCKLRVVKYQWLSDAQNCQQVELGLIAQEVEAVFPRLVQEHEIEGVGIRKNIKQSVLPFMMLKAIQELSTLITAQSATIQSLTERITALEGART